MRSFGDLVSFSNLLNDFGLDLHSKELYLKLSKSIISAKVRKLIPKNRPKVPPMLPTNPSQLMLLFSVISVCFKYS
ncbi:hypothetical protein BpHYR1_025500 [Brachionus plicatilis]|uniref:Uncharacterized protein n=1 Tax=Brachionus plicatilis TaxID=10195 RepID=A0A3M7PIM9_BRAPC|nr:hypothetical protein BpHYR1_025500 [Brachionus plicatilis]